MKYREVWIITSELDDLLYAIVALQNEFESIKQDAEAVGEIYDDPEYHSKKEDLDNQIKEKYNELKKLMEEE